MNIDTPARRRAGAEAAPPAVPAAMPQHFDAARYSDLLLRLYASARVCNVHGFQHEAMAMLQQQLPFDRAWWGRSNVDGPLHNVHCSYLFNLPADVPQRFNVGDPANPVARRTKQSPDRAFCFGAAELLGQPSTAALTEYMGISQSLCIGNREQQGGVTSFVSVMRIEAEPSFSEPERQLLELWMPHLTAALDLCCVTQMARSHHGGTRTMLTTDSLGWLRVAEPGAAELLRAEWPNWNGTRLPNILLEQIVGGRSMFLGRHLHVEIRWSGEHALLTLRPRGPGDLLTRQESAVAEAFSTGNSYREVASMLQLAPATVRHHLRAVYLKLGVNDKAALARLLGNASKAAGGIGL